MNQVLTFLALYQYTEESKTISNNNKQDPLHVLTIVIYKANIGNLDNFSTISYFNFEEPKTYKWAINRSHI